MLRAFSTAATGMTAQQTMVDVIANNLANINTNGFKRSQPNFQDLLYISLQEPGSEVASGVLYPSGIEIGSGVRLASMSKVYTQGELQNTGRSLDLSIMGDGFFEVTLPDGSKRYTRDGSLSKNATGQLVTSTGYTLEPAISIPVDALNVDIAPDGTVSVTTPTGTTSAGQIQLTKFPNSEGLSSEGNNLLSETEASGSPTTGTPGDTGLGVIQSGFLEKSNVQMVTELVNLITAQRAYEINSRAIKAGDDMLNTANNLIR